MLVTGTLAIVVKITEMKKYTIAQIGVTWNNC